ncbi:MAG: hypothetical protein V4490_08600 [Pseudomonadota bacterium]
MVGPKHTRQLSPIGYGVTIINPMGKSIRISLNASVFQVTLKSRLKQYINNIKNSFGLFSEGFLTPQSPAALQKESQQKKPIRPLPILARSLLATAFMLVSLIFTAIDCILTESSKLAVTLITPPFQVASFALQTLGAIITSPLRLSPTLNSFAIEWRPKLFLENLIQSIKNFYQPWLEVFSNKENYAHATANAPSKPFAEKSFLDFLHEANADNDASNPIVTFGAKNTAGESSRERPPSPINQSVPPSSTDKHETPPHG